MCPRGAIDSWLSAARNSMMLTPRAVSASASISGGFRQKKARLFHQRDRWETARLGLQIYTYRTPFSARLGPVKRLRRLLCIDMSRNQQQWSHKASPCLHRSIRREISMNTFEFRGFFSLFSNSLCTSRTELCWGFFSPHWSQCFVAVASICTGSSRLVWCVECKLSTLFWEALNTHCGATGRKSNDGSMAAD